MNAIEETSGGKPLKSMRETSQKQLGGYMNTMMLFSYNAYFFAL